jgi:hypothetical protein
MMLDPVISIKFCGGCNSKIDRGRLATEVKKLLGDKDYPISYNKLDADLVIYISGCTANCAQRYNQTESPAIVVAGESINATPKSECELAAEILQQIKNYI